MRFGRTFAAQSAQAIAQVLTAWTLIMMWADASAGEGIVVWTLLLVVAFVLPLRTNGEHRDRDRAVRNFGSGLLVWGLIAWGLVGSMLDYLSGLRPTLLTAVQMLLLTATVMYMFAGAFFWRSAGESEDDV